jgi:hypothetical protein
VVLRWIGLLVLLAALVWIFTRSDDRGAEPAQAGSRSTPIPRPAQAAELVESEGEQRRAVDVGQTSEASTSAADDREIPSELATLTLRVLMPDGTPWSDARVQVTAGPLSLSGVRFDMGPRSDGSWRYNRMGSDALVSYAIVDVDEHGCARLRRITPGVALEVRASDVLGTVGARAERVVLETGEQRTLELHLESFPHVLHGRCSDERGVGVAGAEVSIDVALEFTDELATTLRARSDDAGEFTTPSLLAARLALHATHAGRRASTIFDTSSRVGSVELLLDATRSLRVELQGSAGDPQPDVYVSVHELTGEELFDTPRTPGENGILFTDLPRRPLELRWGSRCASQSQVVAEHVDRVLVVAPRNGELRLSVGALPGDERTRYAVLLYCADADRAAAPPCSFFNEGRFEASWTLAPGHYALKLVRLPSAAAEQVLGWGEPLRVELRAGETTYARLGE